MLKKLSAFNNRPDFAYENSCGYPVVFGIDEVGRGPLAGPVVAAAVYIPAEIRSHPVWLDVRDSKKLSPVRREILFSVITKQALYGIGQASPEEIDQINILQATFLAMRRAIDSCSASPDFLLVDGNRAPKDWLWPVKTIVKGDSKSVSIAAASIIAKVTRDNIMKLQAQDYPAYGFQSNSGYGTPTHLQALHQFGVTPLHRRSFSPVKGILAGNQSSQ